MPLFRRRARKPRAARRLVVLVIVLWGAALGRDAFDAFIDATLIPPLLAEQSVQVRDRDGTLLRAYSVADGRWRLAVTLDEVDPLYVEMLVRYEDRRFREHGGIDARALGRSVAIGLWNGRMTSGASTLTMQVARLLEESGTGTWQGKLRQMRLALALERQLTKDEILTLYLNHAPFGGNLEGVASATYAWFGRPPARLTPAEAALLVAIPQAPNSRRPDRNPLVARDGRDHVLTRMERFGVIDAGTLAAALTERSPSVRRDFPLLAPHLSDRVVASEPTLLDHRLTVDADLQSRLEALAAQAVSAQGERLQVAIVVADHATGEILASVGSAAYEADTREGFVDMTNALRSPGSTLKPLVYGLAFGRGIAHPETIIEDRPVDFDGYRPQNFDGQFRGEIRVREALQLSLNVPAVSLTEALGPDHLIAALRRAGAEPAFPGGNPGLAVALGGLGLTLEDLVATYGAIANRGTAIDLRATPAPTPGFVAQEVLTRASAWQVADILTGTPRPRGVRGAGIAFKTGTSYGHRDAWAMGFDGRYVIGVWMGRADGTPVPGAFGADRAAPVLFDVFQRLGRVTPLPPPPPETIILATERLPAHLQRFRPPGVLTAENGPRIAFPPDGALVEGESVTVRVADGLAPFTWLANGAPVATTRTRELALDDLGPGFSSLTVIDAAGRSARAQIELRP